MLRTQLFLVVLALLACQLCHFTSAQYDPNSQLSFYPRTANASWSPRWDSNIEFYNRRMTVVLPNGTSLTWPGRIFILQGSGSGSATERSNDVWASPDLGARWYLIAGRTAAGVSAGGGHASTSFTPLSRPATGMDHNGRIWRVGGSAADGTFSTAVWMSTNGGLNWANQAALQGSLAFSPGRERAGLMFDSADNVYLLGGMWRGDFAMTNTIFRSTNLGVTWPWQEQTTTPWQARASGLFFGAKANPHAQFEFGANNPNREILVYTTGWNGEGPPNGLSNEVWITSDFSRSWSRVRSNWGSGLAPFRARDAANGEVTEGGVMILVGGQADDEAGSEILNDVWVSLDGGYSWGICNEDATFSDRRELLTVLDDQGYLYVGGGSDWRTGRDFNDFWRSSFSFNNVSAIIQACGVSMPACGTGLTCWPGDPRTTFYSNGTVTCPASRACAGLDSMAYLDFEPQTLAAPWSRRWAANVESFPKAFSYRDLNGVQRQAPANALILSGGTAQNNDVWMSPDGGTSWQLIAGYVQYTQPQIRAGGASALSSFDPPLGESTGIVDPRNGAIYRVGGYNGGGEQNDVWRTTNAVTWTKQAATNLPARSGANVVIDDAGTMYVVGGVANGAALSDIWVSNDNATTFNRPTLATAPFFTTGGRAKGFLLHRYSWQLRRDILFFGGGWDGVNLYNDVWVSSNGAASWTLVSAAAPWGQRDALFAEITAGGLIVLGGGQTGPYTQNDIWISPDGGFTWSVCGTEQYWPDRRDVAAVFDSDEYFLIMGGRENTNANTPQFNDVYRSTFPLSDLAKVAQACSVNIPWCGPGLSCWPDAPGTVYDGGVMCQQTRYCEGNSSNPWAPSSTGTARPTVRSSTARVRPFDPCRDMVPVPAECDNYVPGGGSSGVDVKPAGLTSWAIGGIVFLVVSVVGGVLFFFYRRWKAGKAGGADTKLDSHLLGTTNGETA